MKEKAEMTREELIALGWMKKPSDKMQEKAKKLTAVEWLVDKLDLNVFESDEEVADVIEQAKEMEKEQIILAHGIKMKGVNNMKCVTGEQYYNETFKSE